MNSPSNLESWTFQSLSSVLQRASHSANRVLKFSCVLDSLPGNIPCWDGRHGPIWPNIGYINFWFCLGEWEDAFMSFCFVHLLIYGEKIIPLLCGHSFLPVAFANTFSFVSWIALENFHDLKWKEASLFIFYSPFSLLLGSFILIALLWWGVSYLFFYPKYAVLLWFLLFVTDHHS